MKLNFFKISRGRMLIADVRRHEKLQWFCKFASILEYSLLLGHDAAPNQKNADTFHKLWKPHNSHLQYLLRYTYFATVCNIGTRGSLEYAITWWLYYCVACYQVLVVVLLLSEIVFCDCHGHQLSNPFHTQLGLSITMGKWSITELPWPSVAQTNTKIPFLIEG